jgi:transposase
MMKPIVLDKKQRAEIEQRRQETHDKRIYARLSAVLWVADGRERKEVAALLGISVRQLTNWLRIYRNHGLPALCVLNYKGDPGKLTPRQVEQLKEKISKGHFRSSQQIQQWLKDDFGVTYSSSGVKDLLRRIGASYHQVSGFLWKGNPDKQRAFVKKVRRHQREAKREDAPSTRRYYVDACHPIWGMDLVFRCWLLIGQRFLVGVGSGRSRLNILGAYCPDDQEYLDIRLTRDNINGEQFVNLLRLILATHPRTEKFILYVDGAKYYNKPVVKEWLARHPQFRLVTIPAYSPNCNLIERLWKFLRKEAFNRWHKTFESMQNAVSEVLDHLPKYRRELETLMTEKFHILKKQDIPVEYREVA